MEPKYIHKKDIIPDSLLETLICSNCNKYLTVLPIGINQDGGNICGRCLYSKNAPLALLEYNSNDFSSIENNIPFPIFGYLNHYFPCVNRYEGCNELLKFANIRNHELVCDATKFIECTYCKYMGIGSQYLHHFKTNHPKYYLAQYKFSIDLNEKRTDYVMKKEGDLLCIRIEFDKVLGELHLTINNRLLKRVSFIWRLLDFENKVFTKKIGFISENNMESIINLPGSDLKNLSELQCEFLPERYEIFSKYYEEVGCIN